PASSVSPKRSVRDRRASAVAGHRRRVDKGGQTPEASHGRCLDPGGRPDAGCASGSGDRTMSRRTRLGRPSVLAVLGAGVLAAGLAAAAAAQEPGTGSIVVAQSGQLPPPRPATGGQSAGATAPKKQTAPQKPAA